jgi:hypothetical protein
MQFLGPKAKGGIICVGPKQVTDFNKKDTKSLMTKMVSFLKEKKIPVHSITDNLINRNPKTTN